MQRNWPSLPETCLKKEKAPKTYCMRTFKVHSITDITEVAITEYYGILRNITSVILPPPAPALTLRIIFLKKIMAARQRVLFFGPSGGPRSGHPSNTPEMKKNPSKKPKRQKEINEMFPIFNQFRTRGGQHWGPASRARGVISLFSSRGSKICQTRWIRSGLNSNYITIFGPRLENIGKWAKWTILKRNIWTILCEWMFHILILPTVHLRTIFL